ncbi:hypothetical protein [Desulfosporosinus metallidurans]|uniref:Uncharacterized protein n=1 Tax=Desulfosporosinus metallidurans TaxID=1888891 RepID=A0A1Q8QRZ2_9FIRM|nr:hypothetical protein DSOL_3219 [Desulfosporosinus metallidurans]
MTKIYGIIRNKKGSSFPLIVAIALALVIIVCGISEYMRLMIIASGVRDAVQSAIISTVNDNYDDVYHGVREGYSGGYKPSSSSWSASIDYGDIYGRLDQTLGLRPESGYHVKYAGEAVEFKLSGLSVDVTNAPLAPSDPGSVQSFLADAVVQLEVPVSFGGKSLPPMRIKLKVQAKYMPLF